jgi:Family of unknown function (DUF5908)
MPIVVNELIFKGVIADLPSNGKLPTTSDRPRPIDQKALVEACVEEVLKILNRERER